MPIVWNQVELDEMFRAVPDRNLSFGTPDTWGGIHSLAGIVYEWNRSNYIRPLVRKCYPDLYGAMMAPLKDVARHIGDTNAAIVIEWRMRHRR